MTFSANINATLPRDKVIVASTTARILKLLAHLGNGVEEVAWNGRRALAFVEGVQTQGGKCFLRFAVFQTRLHVLEAVFVAVAATIVEYVALHCCHVEIVLLVEGATPPHILREPANLRNLWDLPASFLTFSISVEVVRITRTASVAEFLALLS